MKYIEENVKNLFCRFLGSDVVRVSTYYQLYNMLEDMMERNSIYMERDEKELWERMIKDFISPGYLLLEE